MMEIKTGMDIRVQQSSCDRCADRNKLFQKKWVAVDDVYQMIKDAPDKDYVGEYIIRKLRELSEIKDE